MLLIALIPMVLGLVVGWGGLLGWRERLPRGRGAGLRTAATLRSDEAFRVGNRIAGLPTAAGGAVGILGGAAALAMPGTAGLLTGSAVGLAGLAGLTVAGGVLGNRAAAIVPVPPAIPAGCAGCRCGGCEVPRTARARS